MFSRVHEVDMEDMPSTTKEQAQSEDHLILVDGKQPRSAMRRPGYGALFIKRRYTVYLNHPAMAHNAVRRLEDFYRYLRSSPVADLTPGWLILFRLLSFFAFFFPSG